MKTIRELLSEFTQQELAEKLNVRQPTVHSWVSGKRPIPAKRCAQIEKLTNGKVSRRDLRPSDYAEIWPELAEK